MKANEVRIGNYVYDTKGEINKINLAAIEYLLRYGSSGACQVKPIELTPELLEKCGFKKGNICYSNGYSIELLKTDFYLRRSWDGGYYWGFNLSKDKMDCELNDVKSIHYLHQLQNIYFALTNEELNINL